MISITVGLVVDTGATTCLAYILHHTAVSTLAIFGFSDWLTESQSEP